MTRRKFCFDKFNRERPNNQKGSGLISKIRAIISNPRQSSTELLNRIRGFVQGPRKIAPPRVRRWLKNYANRHIVSISICRTPILRIAQKLLNVLSLGKWEQFKRKNHDEIFHLFMYLTFNNGETYRIEKNEVITLERTNNKKKEGQCIDVNMNGKTIKLETFINNSIQNTKGFYQYNPKTNNCQKFVSDLMKYNGLLTNEISQFVEQDIKTLFNQMPKFIENMSASITNLAGRFNILMKGRGVKKTNTVYWA